MTKSQRISALLFRSVCLSFSLVLLVMSLVCRIRLMSCEENIDRLENEIRSEEKLARLLAVRAENRLSLEELDRIAREELGMKRPDAAQLYFGMEPG